MNHIDEKDINAFEKVDTSSWESMSQNAYIRLINQKSIDKYDCKIVFKKFLDLAMCISLQEKKGDVLKSHLFTQEEFDKYNIDIDEAFEIAMKNTENERGRRILTFEEHILMKNDVYPLLGEIKNHAAVGSESSPYPLGFIGGESNDENILILCNKKDTYASAYMSSFNILDEVFRRFDNSNFYIIPTSIYSVMCVKSSFASHKNRKPLREVEEDLLDMIETINDRTSDWKDILSYKIYYYYGDDNKQLYIIK